MMLDPWVGDVFGKLGFPTKSGQGSIGSYLYLIMCVPLYTGPKKHCGEVGAAAPRRKAARAHLLKISMLAEVLPDVVLPHLASSLPQNLWDSIGGPIRGPCPSTDPAGPWIYRLLASPLRPARGSTDSRGLSSTDSPLICR